ncbi:hypothetical protein CUS_4640 [Ruminococcus albus 8]|uniref:Uncharacterized protein n=1 Tax=Ruminococcus albus 8 TaxID=246199 RepID=E9SGS9_RUMAL|nr:hypothetical protein CUS_4640 [Ruminococcus albus 8]
MLKAIEKPFLIPTKHNCFFIKTIPQSNRWFIIDLCRDIID